MTMNCSNFRRLKLAEPQSANAEQIKHENLCPPCAVFARKIDAFERKLHDVAAFVVPDGFAEQILLGVELMDTSAKPKQANSIRTDFNN